ncbi:MAG TPA: nitroreductase family protein [Nitrospirota bacterium]|nr:nitroreductase family protein [Nitrospirota bacterium]
MDVQTAIFHRISVRTYQAEPASLEELEAVRRSGEEAETLTHADMKYHLCTDAQMGKAITGIIGDYGKTIHAPHYLVLAARECDGYLTDAGFRFEQMVLDATSRGLGTCWVGLMFKEATLRSALGLDGSWRMVVLTPLGRPLRKSFTNRMLRTLAGSKGRKPVQELFFWQQHGEMLPPRIMSDQRLMQVFEATRWAPSWMNRQPWRFVLLDREILIYKVKQQEREGKDYHRLDCGIAMCHLHLTARALGISGRWELGTFKVPGIPEAEPIGTYISEDKITK